MDQYQWDLFKLKHNIKDWMVEYALKLTHGKSTEEIEKIIENIKKSKPKTNHGG